MGILSSVFRSRDKPNDRTSGSAYTFFMGGSTAGKAVTERSAMQMTAVYSCVRILSEAIAGLPLQFYKYTESGGKEKAVDHPLYFLLHDEPNSEMTSFVFRETLMTHLLLWGNAYAQIIRNGRGEVIALYPLMADRMSVNRDRDGQLYYEYTVYSDDAPTVKGSTVRLEPTDVLHILGLGFDGLVGYSPIAMAKNAIADYISGVMCAASDKKLSSAVGFKGICRKVLILMLVGIANLLDVQVIGTGAVLRTAVILSDSVQAVCKLVTEGLSDESKALPEKRTEPTISLEKVRGVLAGKSQAGYTAEVRAIVAKYGASRLSDIDSKDFAAVLKDAEAIGHE